MTRRKSKYTYNQNALYARARGNYFPRHSVRNEIEGEFAVDVVDSIDDPVPIAMSLETHSYHGYKNQDWKLSRV